MSWIDAAIVIIWLFFIVTSFQNGLVREVIGLGSVMAGVILAGLFYEDFSNALLDGIDNETTKHMIAFTIIFAATGILGQLVAMLVHPAIALMSLGVGDQLAGAAFGAVKGWAVITGLLILLVTYPVYDMDAKIDKSDFAGVLLDASEPLQKILPHEFDNAVDAFTKGESPSLRPERDPLDR